MLRLITIASAFCFFVGCRFTDPSEVPYTMLVYVGNDSLSVRSVHLWLQNFVGEQLSLEIESEHSFRSDPGDSVLYTSAFFTAHPNDNFTNQEVIIWFTYGLYRGPLDTVALDTLKLDAVRSSMGSLHLSRSAANQWRDYSNYLAFEYDFGVVVDTIFTYPDSTE